MRRGAQSEWRIGGGGALQRLERCALRRMNRCARCDANTTRYMEGWARGLEEGGPATGRGSWLGVGGSDGA